MSELLKDLIPTVEIFKKQAGGYIVVHPETNSGTTGARIRIFDSLKDEVLPYLVTILDVSEMARVTREKALEQLGKKGWRMSSEGTLVRMKKAKKKAMKKGKRKKR